MYIVRVLINIFFGILEVLLTLRLLLRIIGATSASPFVSWLYTNTAPFVRPFQGILDPLSLGNERVFEFSTLFALIVIAILNYIIVAILRSISINETVTET